MVTYNTLHMSGGKKAFSENNYKFSIVVDLNECLNQIELAFHCTICAQLLLCYHLIISTIDQSTH